MVFDTSVISRDSATALLQRFLGRDITVTAVRRLHGGMVNSVLELVTDAEPNRLVAKLNAEPGHAGFENEFNVLRWYRRNTDFPVPEPFGVDTSGQLFPGSCLMMERLPGTNLGHARLSGPQAAAVERRMARIIARLHENKRPTYGSALEPKQDGTERWLDRFEPRIRREFEQVKDRLTGGARDRIGRVLAELDRWLPEFGDPTLVHGDLWATNIIVDPAEARVTGFVDGGANYADVEYELAYLLVFRTVGDAFFDQYTRRHPLRPGFETRCRLYWLHTMLVHVRAFGDAHYVQACERLARELERTGPP